MKLQNVNILRYIHVSDLTPQMSGLMSCEGIKHQIFAEKCVFQKKFQQS